MPAARSGTGPGAEAMAPPQIHYIYIKLYVYIHISFTPWSGFKRNALLELVPTWAIPISVWGCRPSVVRLHVRATMHSYHIIALVAHSYYLLHSYQIIALIAQKNATNRVCDASGNGYAARC